MLEITKYFNFVYNFIPEGPLQAKNYDPNIVSRGQLYRSEIKPKVSFTLKKLSMEIYSLVKISLIKEFQNSEQKKKSKKQKQLFNIQIFCLNCQQY